MRNLYCGEEANDLKSCSVSWASIKAAKMSRNEGSGRKRGVKKQRGVRRRGSTTYVSPFFSSATKYPPRTPPSKTFARVGKISGLNADWVGRPFFQRRRLGAVFGREIRVYFCPTRRWCGPSWRIYASKCQNSAVTDIRRNGAAIEHRICDTLQNTGPDEAENLLSQERVLTIFRPIRAF